MNIDTLFRVLQAVIFIGFVFHRAYYTRKYPPAENDTLEEQPQTAAGTLANLLALPAFGGLVLYLVKPTWMVWARFMLPGWVRWIGVGLAVGGFVLLQWSHNALGKNWSDQPRITGSQTLTTNGPYRWVRHPIYTAFLMILGSPFLITANWFVGGLWLLVTGVDIAQRITYEEARLQARFGKNYLAYKRTTGRLLPRVGKS